MWGWAPGWGAILTNLWQLESFDPMLTSLPAYPHTNPWKLTFPALGEDLRTGIFNKNAFLVPDPKLRALCPTSCFILKMTLQGR